MFKEMYEDYSRHKSDNEVNNTPVLVLNRKTSDFEQLPWKAVKVGDIVKVCDDEAFPSDMVYLSGSEDNGLAFINTMNLDGETNLKERVALDATKDCKTAESLH